MHLIAFLGLMTAAASVVVHRESLLRPEDRDQIQDSKDVGTYVISRIFYNTVNVLLTWRYQVKPDNLLYDLLPKRCEVRV